MKRGLSAIGISLIIILLIGISSGIIYVVFKDHSTKDILESNRNASINPNKQGLECVSFCNQAPKGCYYDYSDDRYLMSNNPDDYEDYFAPSITPVYTDCLMYPCGVLNCKNPPAPCIKGEVNEATILLGETKVVTGLPIQIGFIDKFWDGSLSGDLIASNGFSSIYDTDLPSFNLISTYDKNYKVISNYSVEEVSITNTSVTLRVFCGEEEYFKKIRDFGHP